MTARNEQNANHGDAPILTLMHKVSFHGGALAGPRMFAGSMKMELNKVESL